MSESEKKAKQIAKNTVYLYVRMFFALIVGLFTSRIVLKTLGFADFGIYNVVGSVIVLLNFLQHALRNATSRYITYELGTNNIKQLNRIYSMAINCHVLLAIIIFAILEIGGTWFVNEKLNISPDRLFAANWAFQFSLLNFCLSVIRTPWESNVVAHEKFNFFAIVSILHIVLNLVGVCLLIYSPIDKLITYAFYLTANTLLVFIIFIIYCGKKFQDCKYHYLWDKTIFKDFYSYSGWSMTVNVACGFSTQSISIFFNLFLGVVANAALGISHQVVGQLNAFVASFTQAFNPQIIKSYAANQKQYFFRLLFSSSKISYILMLFISLPVCVNINYILGIWLGEYPSLAASFIIITVVYYLIEAVQSPFVHAVHATGQLKVHQSVVSVIRIATIPCMYLALKFGASGALTMGIWVASNFISGVFRTIYMKRLVELPLHRYLKEVMLKLFIVTVLSLPIPIVLAEVIENQFVAFLVSSLVSVCFVLGLGLFIALDNQERKFVYSMPVVRKITKRLNLI